MNYRHIYHAGNFADVFKHIIVSRIIDYLKRKEQAFRVIDTHAGIGLYNLSSIAAQKTGEWRQGILPFLEKPIEDKYLSLLDDWLDIIKNLNTNSKTIKEYPGSPFIIRQLLRKQDRLTAIELHEQDYKQLAQNFAGDYQSRIIHLDGYLALGAHLPPKEKRGLVLIDPPFEELNEFSRMVMGLIKAYRRFAGGVYAFWYPVKNYEAINSYIMALKETKIPKILRLELRVRKSSNNTGLDGSGMMIINPPFILENEILTLKPLLLERLAQDEYAKLLCEWL